MRRCRCLTAYRVRDGRRHARPPPLRPGCALPSHGASGAPTPPQRLVGGHWRRRRGARARVALCAVAIPASAITPFVVKDIRVEGVQRTEAGTVFSTCRSRWATPSTTRRPRSRSRRCSRPASSATCASRSRTTCSLVIVQERPTISKVDISGNKEFDTETLKKALKEIGVADARIFDRSALDRAEQEIKRQYLSRGRYAAKVTVTVTPQERNRVAINIAIEEGDARRSRGSTSWARAPTARASSSP